MYALPYLLFSKIHQLAIKARRGDRTWRYLVWSSLAGVVAGAMIAIAASFALVLWLAGVWWLALIIGAACIAPIAAGFAVRHVLVPLGWVQLAFYAGLISRPGKDAEAYALCCAAWAFGHGPSPGAEAWIERRRAARVPLGDAEVAATGLVAAGRGDAETARRLLRSIAMLVEDHPAVREVAGEWLAADAAERGAWGELHETAGAARWPATPLTFFLEGVAARRVAASGAPSPGELRVRWLLAPRRRATRALVADRAPAAPVIGPRITDPTLDPAGTPAPIVPLPHAVAAHLTFRTHQPCADALAATVRAWDAALADATTHGWLARRALELDAPPGAVDRALREVAAAVTDELARVADANQLGAPPSHGPVGDGLARRLRHGRLDALETGFTRWAQRRHDGTNRSSIDEWREFIALQVAYTSAVAAGGVELRRLAFPHAWSTGSHMAAWLWNKRREYPLSHAISKWLLAEALAVGDAEAIELGHKNCRLTVPTRLGDIQEQLDDSTEN